MQKFLKEFEVHYYEIDFYQELTSLAFLNYLEETAIAHSEAVGYGVSRLKEKGYGWVLSQWQIQFDQYPQRGEKIKIQTWPSHFERFYGYREFIVLNSQDKVIARASSLWIFLNLQKRRPARIPQEISEAYRVFPEKAISDHFTESISGSADQLEQIGQIGQSEFKVRRSDIDTNDHVNNSKYLEWVLETIPEEVYRNHRLVLLEIAFKKECTYGQRVDVLTQEMERRDQDILYSHQIMSVEGQVNLTYARTLWRKNEQFKLEI